MRGLNKPSLLSQAKVKWNSFKLRMRYLLKPGRSATGQAGVRSEQAALSEEKPLSGSHMVPVGGHELIFGLNWVPAKPDQISEVYAQARKSKMVSHVSLGHLIGFSNLAARGKGRQSSIAAALVLSEGASMGGSEIYAIELGPDLYSLIALEDSSPLPGFDITGGQAKVKLVAENYLRLPHRSSVRRCGSREILDDAEPLNFETIVEDSDYPEARLKAISDYVKMVRNLTIFVVLALTVGGVYMYAENLQKKAELERLSKENDPDVLYEKAFSKIEVSIRRLGSDGLNAMLNTAKKIPLEVGGWLLSQVSCTPIECKAAWSRQQGSYADFEANLPKDVVTKPSYVYLSKGDDAFKLETVHPIALEKNSPTLGRLREKLPLKFDAQIDFVSQMQDYSLLKLNGSVTVPTLFAGSGDIEKIFRPVLSGAWTASGDLWQLEEFQVPSYAIVDTLQITNVSQFIKKVEPNYALTGRYFVKGKSFN